MSTLSFDDSSNLVDIAAAANEEQKEEAIGESNDKQPDLLLLDEPDASDITESQETKSKSKKSKAKKLLKRAKSPISGAINKTTKEFKKLSNLPKHHHTSAKSPIKSPSRENLTQEYSKLEKKLAEKDSEEWKQFMQMQERVQQVVLKTQSSLNKYSSHSEDEQSKESTGYSTKWTGFEEEGGLEPEVIDTSLNPEISITCANEIISIDTVDLLDSKEESSLINPSFIDTMPISPVQVVNSDSINMENFIDDPSEKIQDKSMESDSEILGIVHSDVPILDTETNKRNQNLNEGLVGLDDFISSNEPVVTQSENVSQLPVLSGYTFTSPMPNEPLSTDDSQETKASVESDILMFEKPLSEIAQNASPEIVQASVSKNENDQDSACEVKASLAGGADLFSLEDEVDAVPVQPVEDISAKPSGTSDPVLSMFSEPLQPLQPVAATPSAKDQVVPDILDELANVKEPLATNASVPDDFASFDPMKETFVVNTQVQSSPISMSNAPGSMQIGGPVFSASPQTGMTFGSVPSSSIEHDIFSKIKKLSGSQPVSPAKRRAPEKPKDHFGFVKKELKAGEEDGGEYKSLAALQNRNKTEISNLLTSDGSDSQADGIDSDVVDTSNNPFMSQSFNENVQSSETFSSTNAAALFGLEPETMNTQIDTGFDLFIQPEIEKKAENSNVNKWADLESTEVPEKTTSAKAWIDPTNFDKVDFAGEDMDAAWDDDDMPKEKKQTGDAWGGEQEVSLETHVDKAGNPFQDDFSELDDIPAQQDDNANPFLSDSAAVSPAVPVSAAGNPFLEMHGENMMAQTDLLGGVIQPTVLSDSESFFLDSVADSKSETEPASDDIFDPFKVTPKSNITEQKNADADPLDLFSSVAASGDKQLAKPSDDDHSFTLDIKPMTEGDKSKTDGLPVAPALAPPPKAPKSPQPPRENPFDRDSPPEENFAQFEVMDTEKPKEPVPKSVSTESGSPFEEEEEANLEPLEPFLPECTKESFKLMLRYPTKKKLAGNRYWKNVCVKLEKQKDGLMVRVLNDARDPLPIQELLLQPCYSLSDLVLQQYDQYGKIHTFKLQYVFYKERVGIKTERITPSIVKFKKRNEKPKATMILDHSPQVSELLKFGSLDKEEIMQFIHTLEDVFMNLEAHREKTLTYTKDEVTAEVHDEYYAELDKNGRVLSQKARVRVFVLAFLSGMPIVELGLNDKRRQGKEVVGRCDIIPIKTEEWIKLENVEFHGSVDKEEFEKSNSIKFRPLDACQFELMRYRVRLRENKELPLQLTIQQILKNRKCEVRCDLLVTGYHSYSKKHGQFPCEDIEVRFPIPEVWIYMFRYERRFGYGSVHSAARKPGKIKGNYSRNT